MRKIYATVEGTLDVPVRVKRKIEIEVNEDLPITDEQAVRHAVKLCNVCGIKTLYIDDIEMVDSRDEIDGTITCIDESDINVSNVIFDKQ